MSAKISAINLPPIQFQNLQIFGLSRYVTLDSWLQLSLPVKTKAKSQFNRFQKIFLITYQWQWRVNVILRGKNKKVVFITFYTSNIRYIHYLKESMKT